MYHYKLILCVNHTHVLHFLSYLLRSVSRANRFTVSRRLGDIYTRVYDAFKWMHHAPPASWCGNIKTPQNQFPRREPRTADHIAAFMYTWAPSHTHTLTHALVGRARTQSHSHAALSRARADAQIRARCRWMANCVSSSCRRFYIARSLYIVVGLILQLQ